MAQFSAIQKYDMSGTVITPATLVSVSSSQVTLDFGAVLVGRWYGEGLEVSGNDLVAGTLATVDLGFVAGGLGYQITAINKPAATMYDAFSTLDRQTYFRYVLNGNDSVIGSSDADFLRGYGAKDVLYGNGGADTLQGMAGNDTLDGGPGNDVLTGGAGADHFRLFAGAIRSDVVTDFSHAQHDKIELSSVEFGSIGATLGLREFKAAANINPDGGSSNANAKILYDTDTGRLYYDADGSAGAFKPQLVAVLGEGEHPSLSAADCVVT
jgi:Ca2+-binding RTX toxin-like protein